MKKFRFEFSAAPAAASAVAEQIAELASSANITAVSPVSAVCSTEDKVDFNILQLKVSSAVARAAEGAGFSLGKSELQFANDVQFQLIFHPEYFRLREDTLFDGSIRYMVYNLTQTGEKRPVMTARLSEIK